MKNEYSLYAYRYLITLCLLTFSSINLFGQCKDSRKADSLILVKLYNETNGKDWKNNEGWLKSNIDSWYGINVSPDACNVEKIDLALNDLKGNLPSELSKLKQLRYLDVRANALKGALPDYSQQVNITHLNFNLNEFSGNLPNYENLKNLTFFACAFNKLSGNLPNIANLIYLEHFNIGHNEITGSYPNISKLNYLQLFFIQFNQIKGEFNNLAEIENLREFSMSNNPITINLNILNIQSSSPLVIITTEANRIGGHPENSPAMDFPIEFGIVIDDPNNPVDLQAITLNHPDFNNLPDIMQLVNDGTFNGIRATATSGTVRANNSELAGSIAKIFELKKDGSKILRENVTMSGNNLKSKIKELSSGFYKIEIGEHHYKLLK